MGSEFVPSLVSAARGSFALWDYFDIGSRLPRLSADDFRRLSRLKRHHLVLKRLELWLEKLKSGTKDKRYTLEKDKCTTVSGSGLFKI